MREQRGSVAVAALEAGWRGLRGAAVSGQLRLEPGVAERCAVACEQLRQQLRDRRADVRGIGRLWGFGTLPSGEQLRGKFEGKAQGSPGSAEEVLRQHMALLVDMAAAYRAAGAAFVEHDRATAEALRASS